MIVTRQFPKEGESLWLVVTLVDYILYKLGYSIDYGICPFCGKRVRNMYRHLVTRKNKCHYKLRALVKDIMTIYYEAISKMERKKKSNKTHVWRCTICGYTGKGDEVILHVYEKHLKHLIIPIK